ncbi:hypothetical protein [Halomonas huangheensis]|uniref:Uncharacterized protein n=1 Tax=Halomonas huangheensis TaxID=1178482 RepID=W1N110_9GAMM|nr:hypothetical protein [Halomonas huangheensis]ALM52426.1 hypothetical protein AR456_09135 [Halomonas huangheensis]ERL49184.1 hypothetical protein BJB45_07875 [Halomonas huangheensis]
MNADDFVDAFKRAVKDGAVQDTISVLKSPPGRRPAHDILEISKFYNELEDREKEEIEKIIQYVADGAAFGALCVLDGVRAIEENGEKGELSLFYKKDGQCTAINENKDLHDIYLSLK